jgi:hypothetical protein
MFKGSLVRRLRVLVVAIGLSVSLFGCMSRITKDNAEKIKTGMTDQEVSNILGAANETAEVKIPDFGGMVGAPNVIPNGAKSSTWREGDKVITVTFVNGKVFSKTTAGF